MNRRGARAWIAGLVLSLGGATVTAWAGGPRSVNGLGQPMAWDTSGPVVYNPDRGSLGTFSSGAARDLVASAFDVWAAAADSLRFSEGALLPYDLTAAGVPATNPAHYLNFFRKSGDGLSPVIFDADGSIIDDLFGPGARFGIIGVGALDTRVSATDTRIHEASIIINGAFFDGQGLPGSPPDLSSQTAFMAAIVHEIGHFLNLDHTVLNRELVGDGNAANDVHVPTMYPLLADDEAALANLNPDDIVAAKMLYETGPATVGISGSVATRDTKGGNVWFQGAQVVLRKVDDPYGTAYAAISGALFYPCNPGGVCYPNCDTTACDPGNPPGLGSFSVNWIVPGSYKVCVRQIDTRFSASSGSPIGPLSPPPVLPGPEECWDEGESSNPSSDDPDDVMPLYVGSLVNNFDIVLDDLPVTDSFEPNNTLATASPLEDLPSGADTIGAVLAASDLDYFAIPVLRGQEIHVDIDAAEFGSALDAVIGLYDATGALAATSDDTLDPDTGAYSFDPALAVTAHLTGTATVVVSSFPDSDLNGAGGVTAGPYWLRVEVRSGDADGDGVTDPADNCPTAANPGQEDLDGDGLGNACDEDDDGDGLSDSVEAGIGSNALGSDTDGDGVSDGAEVAAGTDPNDGAAMPNRFGAQRIISTLVDVAWRVLAADLDGDGNLDIISASANDDKIAWYENTDGAGTFGAQRVIATAGDGPRSVFAADVDGDGDVDVVASSTNDDEIAWYQNTDGAGTFGPQRIISTLANGPGAIFGADIDGDGDLDLLSASYLDDKIAWYENLDGGGTFGPQSVISLIADGAYSVFAADVDGDGDLDVLSASIYDNKLAWYENLDGAGTFGPQQVISTTANQMRSVLAADLDRDGDIDVIAGSTIDDTLSWYENLGVGTFGPRRVISTLADSLFSTFAADVDGDGDTDVLSASLNDDKIAWYENIDGAGTFGPQRVITTLADSARSVVVADVDGDGDADVLSASSLDNKIAWYENRAIHRSAAYPSQVLVAPAYGAYSVHTADVNGDGKRDILSASFYDDTIAWYEGNGVSDPVFTPHIISTAANGARSVHTADLDRDGDVDVLSASAFDRKIAWYENDGGALPGFTARTIDFDMNNANSVFPADVDGDGDLDVLATAEIDDKVAWYENNGDRPPSWTIRTVATVDVPASVAAADLDGDGDTDPVAAIGSGVVWYENNGAVPPTFTSRTIMSPWQGIWVRTGDVNGDGHIDVVAANRSLDRIAWYENNGARPPTFTAHSISTAGVTSASVALSDFDGDGDADVVSCDHQGNITRWHENVSGDGLIWVTQTLSTAVGSPFSVAAADLNGDGRTDLLSASAGDNQVAWYPNQGGQLALTATDIAPATIGEGQSAALLKIVATHRGRSGDSPVALSRIGVVFEESPGDRLTGVEANDLVENLYLYLDNGSGFFEAGLDTLVTTVAALSDLPHSVLLGPADPNVRVSYGSPRTYFIVVQMTAGASSRTPRSFRVVHSVSGGAAIDPVAGHAADLEYAADLASRIIRAGPPDLTSPSVTGVLPADRAIDVALGSDVILLMSEAVDPATATPAAIDLSTSAGVKVQGSVEPSSDGLMIRFAPEARLAVNSDYVVTVTAGLRDLAGNAAVPFSSTFDTLNDAASGTLDPDDIGDPSPGESAGAVVPGPNANDHSGHASAALGDVNGDGRADLAIGAPNADVGAILDAGNVTLVFGGPGLQSNAGTGPALVYRNSAASAGDRIGTTVSRAGDLGGPAGVPDGLADLVIGAPYADANGADAGVVYLVFGNAGLDELAPATLDLAAVAACAQPTLCGLKIVGQASGDRAGTSAGYAGDINKDGKGDLLIGAPAADPAGRADAGKAYLIYGPFGPGTLDLANVGSVAHGAARAGLVFPGENAGDHAGEAVSCWQDSTVDHTDDLLIGAPEAGVNDEFGSAMTRAGLVYAIHGGLSNLNDTASPGVIELSRVANGQADQVAGTVFLGSRSEHHIGRSVTGAVDVNDDGEDEVIIGAHNEAWVIPGNGPKGTTAGTPTGGPRNIRDLPTLRTGGESNVVDLFGGKAYVAGADAEGGDLTVGAAGDINSDGIEDFVAGAALADPEGRVDAGKAYFVYGGTIGTEGAIPLPEIGTMRPGLSVEGRQAGDQLGSSVGGGFDLNADGISDGLVGAPFADPSGRPDAGETYIISPLAPSEVARLVLGKSGGTTTLEWTVTDRARAYNVYRGRLSRIVAAGAVRTSDMCDTLGACRLACGINTDADADQLPDTVDPAQPPPMDAYCYLVTGINLNGEGPIGASRGAPRQTNDAQCP